MIKKVMEIKNEGDTAGGVIELRIKGVPAGLGEPVFDKLQATLSHALMSIGAIKGIEFGAGFKVANMKGSECNDHPYLEGKKVSFKTNNAGGILGGISNGDEIVIKLACAILDALYMYRGYDNVCRIDNPWRQKSNPK
jgi:chorismate synthase